MSPVFFDTVLAPMLSNMLAEYSPPPSDGTQRTFLLYDVPADPIPPSDAQIGGESCYSNTPRAQEPTLPSSGQLERIQRAVSQIRDHLNILKERMQGLQMFDAMVSIVCVARSICPLYSSI